MRREQFGIKAAAMHLFAVSGLALFLGVGGALAQSGAQEQPAQKAPAQATPAQTAEAAKENQRKSDEFVEAAGAINGPAGNPECVWLGRRVVVLMWRDDLDTAFRHLDLYDRFGCPGNHIQSTFRCIVRFGAIDPKVPESLNQRVHACWVNPAAQPQAAATSGAPATPAPAPAAPAEPAK